MDIPSLSKRIRRGNSEAFTVFYDLFYARVYALALALAKGGPAGAEEITQAVFIKAAHKFPKLNSETEAWRWVATVTRNAFIDQCRRVKSDRMVSLDDVPDPVAPERLLDEALEAALHTLSPEENQFIEAKYFENASYEEISQKTSLTVKAVESKLARIREKIRASVKEHLSYGSEKPVA
jgi:RNA polymerase sigma factor (sigma-70 family)